MTGKAWMALLLGGVVLVGCSQQTVAPTGSTLRIYAADVTGGAKICEWYPKVVPEAGTKIEAGIKVGNDGGWCGLPLHLPGPKPYAAGLLTERPDHGSVTIHSVGDDTRVDYVPDRGFAGHDTFTIKLLPGSAVVQVAVTVAGS